MGGKGRGQEKERITSEIEEVRPQRRGSRKKRGNEEGKVDSDKRNVDKEEMVDRGSDNDDRNVDEEKEWRWEGSWSDERKRIGGRGKGKGKEKGK